MPFKWPKLRIFLIVLSALCIILKLLISYLFPLSRLLLIVFVPTTIICLLVFFIANWRTLKNGRILTGIIVPLAAIVFTLLPIDSQLEIARFHVAKGAYESAVQKIEENIPNSQGIVTGQFDLQFPFNFLIPYGKADYYKMGDSVAILFPASETLSIVRFYAYFSDSTAKDLLEHPRKYGSGSNVSGVDQIDKLDGPHWCYVLTWGAGVPEDPYL